MIFNKEREIMYRKTLYVSGRFLVGLYMGKRIHGGYKIVGSYKIFLHFESFLSVFS